MAEFGSFVTGNIGDHAKGLFASVVTHCGKETNPADTRFALAVTEAGLEHAKATCPLETSNRCAAMAINEVIGDGVSMAKVELYSVKCVEPCANNLPTVDTAPAQIPTA